MAKRAHITGVYAIELVGTDRFYVGSSSDIGSRWSAHRHDLNSGKHNNPKLRHAWIAYGPDAFRMFVLEECDRAELVEREQAYIDGLQPWFNIAPKAGLPPPASPEFIARLRARMAAITHCPKGHLYDDANTYMGKAGKRICRACNALRVSEVYASETPEQREARRVRMAAQAQREQDREARRIYAATHREQKRAYDQSRADLKRERDHRRRAVANLTPEQLAAVREAKRAAYWRDRDKNVQDLRERYRRTHPTPEPATSCKSGHPYTDESVDSKGVRLCKTCRAISKRAYRDRLKAAPKP